MRNNEQKITASIDMFFRGMSTRQVQAHLDSFYPHNADYSTIYRWVIKYSKKISKFTESLKLKVGAEMQVDEIEIGNRKSRYHGWFMDSIDPTTRFMVSSNFGRSRTLEQAKMVLSNAKRKTENQIQIVTSDGWMAYPPAIQKVWGFSNKTKQIDVKHNLVSASKGDGFNYPVERMHNTIRQRINSFRGFHGSEESADNLMSGYEIFYNFVRKHLGIKAVPSDVATDLRLDGKNRWLGLIRMSSKT